MAATTSAVPVTSAWTADLAAGAASMLIQRKTTNPVLIYIGASAPPADSMDGIDLAGDARDLSLGSPAFAAGDKVFARAPYGDAKIAVVKS